MADFYDALFVAKVLGKGSGGGGDVPSAPKNDVTFFDYDGTVLYSYTASEFAELSEMPPNPTRKGLTAQGWNWSLADAKAYTADYGKLNVGQMYATDNGETRIYITLGDGRLSPTLGLGVNGTVDVDWGDGTAHGTLMGTSESDFVILNHTYSNAGDYVIRLTPTNGTTFKVDGGSSKGSQLIFKSANAMGNENRVYQDSVTKIEFGTAVTSIAEYAFSGCYALNSITIPDTVTSIDSGAFRYCYTLNSITIPNTVTSIGGSAFNGCSALNSITIPNTVTSIGGSAFNGCYALNSITIPNTVTSIGGSAFSGCYALNSITIPNTVTSIGSSAFSGCSALNSITIPNTVTSIGSSAFGYCCGLGYIKFKRTTPPTVSNSNAFSNISTDCTIYVPAGTLETYQNATNYPDPDTYQYVEY